MIRSQTRKERLGLKAGSQEEEGHEAPTQAPGKVPK